MRVILVRHGQTVSNIENRYQGHADTSLSDFGRFQVAKLGERLKREKIDAVYSSDLSRARETAEVIAGYHDLPVITDIRLRECCFGDWEGLTVSEIQERYPDLFSSYHMDSIKHRAPGGERLEELQSRVAESVEEIASCHPNGTVVVAVHGGPIRAFICHALNLELTSFRKMNLDNCGITTFSHDKNGKWFLEVMNDTCHLDGLDAIFESLDETSSFEKPV
ncbi:MAG: histidine phosphatase family protein [Armatimonadota bacterium]